MKIAFASEDNLGLDGKLAYHFGRCPYYVFVDVENKEVLSVQTKRNPFFNQHAPGVVPQFIAEEGADIMIAGGMGSAAIDWFRKLGVTAITTEPRKIGDILQDYLNGEISGVEACSS